MTRTTKTLIIAGATAILGSVAIAGAVHAHNDRGWDRGGDRGARHGMQQRGGERGGFAMMEQFDLNKDGNLTQAEIDQARKDKFGKFDANKDGKLSLKEFEALWLETTQQQMVRSFQRLDPNGDASVTAEEYSKPYQRMVERADRNGDGQINKDDRRSRSHRGERSQGQGPQGQAPQMGPKGGPNAQ